jgi:hypothetical protein
MWLALTVSSLGLTAGGVLAVGVVGQAAPANATVGHRSTATKHEHGSHAHHTDCQDGRDKDQNWEWNSDSGRNWGNDGKDHWNHSWGGGGGGDWNRDFDGGNAGPNCEKDGNREPVNREPVRKEPVRQELGTQKPVHKEPVRKEPVHKELGSREPVHKEPVNREPVHKEPVHKELGNREPVHR